MFASLRRQRTSLRLCRNPEVNHQRTPISVHAAPSTNFGEHLEGLTLKAKGQLSRGPLI